MPMRGPAAIAERNLTIRAGLDPAVVLRIDDEKPADETALSGALTDRPVVTWTGIVVPSGALQHMDFWLADLDGYCRVLLLGPARAHGLPEPAYDYGSMGAYAGGTFAYLTRRDTALAGVDRPLMTDVTAAAHLDLPAALAGQAVQAAGILWRIGLTQPPLAGYTPVHPTRVT